MLSFFDFQSVKERLFTHGGLTSMTNNFNSISNLFIWSSHFYNCKFEAKTNNHNTVLCNYEIYYFVDDSFGLCPMIYCTILTYLTILCFLIYKSMHLLKRIYAFISFMLIAKNGFIYRKKYETLSIYTILFAISGAFWPPNIVIWTVQVAVHWGFTSCFPKSSNKFS